ncbi:Receptor-like serine/threonine-protein kinase [Heracleum sosnowskyi]|uniref:Receptor-like serine/threonine-protein kinase n=1 Tax=Heracleum sosnowskyi TaxID=360622 RepID=A0AAD8JI57_9APIA|nr:Receptor-like serine/threonine-protein kinase [Heracleum sosnowskyi]
MLLYANYRNPQPYWSIRRDNRRIIDKVGGDVSVASLNGNSWRFYDKSKALLWQFIFSDNADTNSTWVASLGDDGFITFYNLQSGSSNGNSPTRIPADSCSRPEPCNSYEICYNGNRCQCPSVLDSKDKCGPGIGFSCNESQGSVELVNAGNGLSYFVLGLVPPSSKGNLDGCKSSYLADCSCLAMFHEEKSQNCFHFETVGSLQGSNNGIDFVSYIKVSRNGGHGRDSGGDRGSKKKVLLVVAILLVTTLIIVGLLYVGIRCYQKQNGVLVDSPKEAEEDSFLENISGMPIRFSHKDLQIATNNFTTKLGQGGFGSVYEGVLPDGTRLAVKQLEGIGQGKKEFRAEVSSIGSIHHLRLVRLKGFCTEEKSDVYSYGMVLLEIIGGRKNYDASETEEKCHFPSYAFKMMEQGKMKDILDVKLKIAEDDERVSIAIKVALWCIQYDMHLRPSMTKVVQMLEQVSHVPSPPSSSQQMNSHFYLSSFKSTSEHSTSLGPLDLNSCADFSAVRLSGPR